MGSLNKAHDFPLCIPVEATVQEQWYQLWEGGHCAERDSVELSILQACIEGHSDFVL